MRKILVIALLTLTAASLYGGGAKETIHPEKRVTIGTYRVEEPVSGVKVTGKWSVEIVKGDSFKVEIVKAPSKGSVYLKEGLLIFEQKGIKRPSGEAIVTTPDSLQTFSVSGSGALTVASVESESASFSISGSGTLAVASVESESASFSISGAGKMGAERVSATLGNIKVSGSGDVKIAKGHFLDTVIDISGSGNVKLDSLQCEQLDSKISGSGNIKITEGHVAGDGNFFITGSGSFNAPGVSFSKKVDVYISGSGKVFLKQTEGSTISANIKGSGSLKSF